MAIIRKCKYVFFVLVLTVLNFSSAYAYENSADNLDKKLELIYQKAEEAINKGDKKAADFWLARYMGKTLFNPNTKKNIKDLYSLFEKHNLAPTSFISHKYDSNFMDWFIYRPSLRWKHDAAIWDKEKYLFELVVGDDGKYFVIILAYPHLEGWIVRQNGKHTTAIIALGDCMRKPQIVSGVLKDGVMSKEFKKIELDIEDHPLQHIWEPEFFDLDNDGVPEIWLRYNITWGSGFSQELAIYKIENNQLILFKKFTGNFEGIVRRLDGNKIEVAEGFTDKEATGHMGYNQHHVETFEFKDGDFVKVSERNVSHILWSDEWKKYYFKEGEKQ